MNPFYQLIKFSLLITFKVLGETSFSKAPISMFFLIFLIKLNGEII